MAHHKTTTPLFVKEHIENLYVERTEKGLSRRKVANESGVSIEYIGKYERGYCYPNPKNYNQLARVLNWEEWG